MSAEGDESRDDPKRTLSGRFPADIGRGVVIGGTYRLDDLLGEGAMGVVYRARDVHLDRTVAIKFIQPDLVRMPSTRERFLREARLMAQVHHVNVVQVHAYGEHGPSPYFVMEYLPGTTVDRWQMLHARPHLAVDEVIGILEQCCRGVDAIHAAGAVHGDLKPSNILIGTAFRVCVTDLGLARKLDELDRQIGDMVSGTPAYIAPERALGTELDLELEARADVYSLGVMAFELIVGRLPFVRPDPARTMLAHIGEAPPVPSEVRPELPLAFDRAILDALAKDPETRTPSALAFRRALLEAREHARSAPHPALRLLVADDDPDFRALVEVTLRYAYPDSEIVSVGDGSSALRAMEERPASLAIVDLDMPGLNGVELTAAFQATPSLAAMPILVVTATGGAPDWRLLSALGADGFLVKPIDPISLLALARRTLAGSAD